MNAPSFRRILSAALAFACALCLPVIFSVRGATSLSQVRINADSIGPRPIEELTGKNVARDYAFAMRDLATALSANDAGLLDDYFTGFAKEKLKQRIADQKAANIRVRYTDQGHEVKALFYSLDGDEMQLADRASLEVKIYDGDKLVYQESMVQNYLVLMTPGADRWFVRSFDPVGDKQF
jgi:hypothetical protein